MNYLNNKKGVVDKVFVMVFSVIIIGFAGFLVIKFAFQFTDDTDKRFQTKFYDDLQRDYSTVYKTYGSEKVLTYKIDSDVEYICFLPETTCLTDIEYISSNVSNYDLTSLIELVEAGDNIVMFDNIDYMNSYDIGDFNSDDGCFCIKPILSSFSLVLENRKNTVYFREG